MIKAPKNQTAKKPTPGQASDQRISLSLALQRRPNHQRFGFWLVGDTPIICHAWSEKARREMLGTQVRAMKPAKEARDPQQDFVNSLYDFGDGAYGFPVMAVKNMIVAAAHRDKGLAKVAVQAALWLDFQMVKVRPALAGAVCNMPLLRIHGSQPEMREDMVRIGGGVHKTANLAYRGQFEIWALRVTGHVNTDVIDTAALAYLIADGGASYGLGDWRNERKGVFGACHLANVDEEPVWDKFAAGNGPLPVPNSYRQAAQ